MVRRDVSRRDVLRTGAVAIGVTSAGCSVPETDAGSGTLTFANGSDGFRRRTETVYDRVAELVGRSIRTETTVRLIDVAEMRDRSVNSSVTGDTVTQQLAHRALGLTDRMAVERSFEFAGAYYPDSASILLVAEDDGDVDDQLLAHELCHAIQFQNGGVSNWDRGWSAGFDRYNAQQSLLEGTAMYVEDAYVGGCEGDFANCQLSQPTRVDPRRIDPALLLIYGSYFNGHEFAAALATGDGWDAVWNAHDNPPISTGQILHPEWYPDRTPERVSAPVEPAAPWARLDTERLGMQALFLTLWRAGALPDGAIYAGQANDRDRVYSSLIRFRSPVTDRWRGDAFTGFERSDGRYGWRWRIRWDETSAAEAGYERFREWAIERGSETSDDAVWERDDGVEAIALDGEDVLVGTAPSLEDLDAIAPTLVD